MFRTRNHVHPYCSLVVLDKVSVFSLETSLANNLCPQNFYISCTKVMPVTATETHMEGAAGVVNGKIVLSQGLSRSLGSGIAGSFTEIPVIDLSPLTSATATDKDRARLISELQDACERVGFFVVRNHGIDWQIVEDAFAAVDEFFRLPLETKMKIHQASSPSYMGYEQPYYTNVDRLKRG